MYTHIKLFSDTCKAVFGHLHTCKAVFRHIYIIQSCFWTHTHVVAVNVIDYDNVVAFLSVMMIVASRRAAAT